MAQGKAPPEGGRPDYNPDAPPREDLGDDVPGVNEYEPQRSRNAPTITVIVTVAAVLLLAVLYFLFRG